MGIRMKWNAWAKIGVGLILMGLFSYSADFLIKKDSLIYIDGKVERVETVYHKVTSSYNHKAIKAELSIELEHYNAKYSIFKNIGAGTNYAKFEDIKYLLQRSKEARIWMKKAEIEKVQAKIFQIAINDDEIIYSIQEAKNQSKNGLIGCFVVGIIMIFRSGINYGKEIFIGSGESSIPKWIIYFINILAIFLFSVLTYAGIKSNSNEMSLLFGGITIFYMILFYYFGVRDRS